MTVDGSPPAKPPPVLPVPPATVPAVVEVPWRMAAFAAPPAVAGTAAAAVVPDGAPDSWTMPRTSTLPPGPVVTRLPTTGTPETAWPTVPTRAPTGPGPGWAPAGVVGVPGGGVTVPGGVDPVPGEDVDVPGGRVAGAPG